MSKLLPRLPLPPTANDVMVWDGTEFRPSKSVTVNPIMASISAAALAIAIGTGIDDANRIGFLPSTAVPGSEALTLYVGGQVGPKWTARSTVVDETLPDGGNVILGATTGTQWGTSSSQKQGWYGATPIVRPSSTTDLRAALINLGLYTTGGASPLDLNGGAFTAQSVTVSGLTSGRVPFATTAGLLTDGAGLKYSANALTVGDGTSVTTIFFSGAAGSTRTMEFQTAGSNRWRITANATAEGGANAGSNLQIAAFDDAAANIDIPLIITRAAGGAAVWTRPLQPGSGTVGAPSYAFSTDTNTGLYRAAAGAVGVVIAGVERFRFVGSTLIENFNAVAMGTGAIASIGALTVHGTDGAQCVIAVAAYGQVPGFYARRANGTAAAQTALALDDQMFGLFVQGYETTTPGYGSQRNVYRVNAAEAWTSTAQGIYHDWYTAPAGSSALSFRMRLMASGNLGLGTSTDGMTASGSLAIAQDFAHRGTKIGFMNTAPIVQKTGYGTPTGNAYQASFAAGSITLPNLAAGVAQLILDLKAYGIIGA